MAPHLGRQFAPTLGHQPPPRRGRCPVADQALRIADGIPLDMKQHPDCARQGSTATNSTARDGGNMRIAR